MKTKHLEGPWSYTFDHDGDHAIFSSVGRLIAVTDGVHDLPLEIDEANARLIAAAPELLDILKSAVKQGCDCWNNCEQGHSPDCFMTKAKVAIAKAEGGEE